MKSDSPRKVLAATTIAHASQGRQLAIWPGLLNEWQSIAQTVRVGKLVEDTIRPGFQLINRVYIGCITIPLFLLSQPDFHSVHRKIEINGA